MKKTPILGLVVLLLCLSLSGCKSSDYKKAASLEEAGDYSAALEIYKEISDYKDSEDHIALCEAMISAIDGYEAAKASAEEKNVVLDTEISSAESVIAEGKKPLDDTLMKSLKSSMYIKMILKKASSNIL